MQILIADIWGQK